MARFLHQPVPSVTTDDLAATIFTLPGWVRVGISAPDERMRLRAAEALAQSMFDKIAGNSSSNDPDQLDLSL